MVIVHTTVRHMSDKHNQAREWTTKVATHVRRRNPKQNLRLPGTVLRDVVTLRWITDHESLARWKRFQKELEADKGYQDLFAKGANKGWRIEGSRHLQACETIVCGRRMP